MAFALGMALNVVCVPLFIAVFLFLMVPYYIWKLLRDACTDSSHSSSQIMGFTQTNQEPLLNCTDVNLSKEFV